MFQVSEHSKVKPERCVFLGRQNLSYFSAQMTCLPRELFFCCLYFAPKFNGFSQPSRPLQHQSRAPPLSITYRLPSALIGVFLQLRSFSTFITFLFSCCTQKTMWFPFLSNWNYTILNTSQSCYEDKKGHRWESTFCKRLCAVQVLVYLVVDCIPITFPPSLLNSSIT